MKVILCDFARVILLPRDLQYTGTLEALHESIQQTGSAFLSLNALNEELLSFLESIPKVEKYIFTAGSVHTHPEISERVFEVFRQAYTTTEVGYTKGDPEAFELVAGAIGHSVSDIFFIDDMLENVKAAKAAGMNATQFITNSQIKTELSAWLKEV